MNLEHTPLARAAQIVAPTMPTRRRGTPRVFVGLENVAGYGERLVRGLQRQGITAALTEASAHPFGYTAMRRSGQRLPPRVRTLWVFLLFLAGLPVPRAYPNLELDAYKIRGLGLIVRWLYFIKALLLFDVFIFLFGESFLPDNRDLKLLRLLGKRTAMVFMGCDLRQREITLHMQKGHSFCKYCDLPCDLEFKRQRSGRVEQWAHRVFAQPEFAQLLTKPYSYQWLPIDLEEWPYVGVTPHSGPLRLLHAPSNPALKGTRFVRQAVADLIANGETIELVLLQGMNNAAVHQAITNCDIVLDQFVGGWYGMLAVEAMATGKPVLAYLRPDLLHCQCSEVPIVNTTPEALRDTLCDLIHDGERRRALGQAGRAFVERRHECGSVARGMLHDILGADRADAS
jgi:hypothetical protein